VLLRAATRRAVLRHAALRYHVASGSFPTAIVSRTPVAATGASDAAIWLGSDIDEAISFSSAFGTASVISVKPACVGQRVVQFMVPVVPCCAAACSTVLSAWITAMSWSKIFTARMSAHESARRFAATALSSGFFASFCCNQLHRATCRHNARKAP
jgi:hypothetical protein